MPVKNKELARKIRDHILAEPLRLNMRSWVIKRGDFDHLFDWGREEEYASCGTAACIGGWAELLSGEYVGAGAELLGLDTDEEAELFYRWFHSPEYRKATVAQRAQMAARKINKLFELDS